MYISGVLICRRMTASPSELIVPPPEAVLRQALAIDARVHYFPTSRGHFREYVGVDEQDWIKFCSAMREQQREDKRLRGHLYMNIILALSRKLYERDPKDDRIMIRGSAVCIGDSIALPRPMPDGTTTIKGIAEVVSTGSENQYPTGNYSRAPKTGDLSEVGHGYPGMYAGVWTEKIRQAVPPDKKQLIHPLVLVRTGAELEVLTDVVVLDYLDL